MAQIVLFQGATFDECLAAALEAIANLEAEAYDDDIEDEGNDIAYMRHLENKAMDFAMSDPSWGYE
jgi:predicted RNase H-like HicB family nuclease